MKFREITVIVRNNRTGWEHLRFTGIRAHGELIDYARNPIARNKEIMVVSADSICLYSRLSSDKNICWADLIEFFSDRNSLSVVGGGQA